MSRAATAGYRPGVFGTDYSSFEVLVASCVALSVPVWSALLLSMSALGDHANAPSIAPNDEIKMSVKPVVDMESPLLKLGGGKGKKIKLPSEWVKPPPQTEPNPDDAAGPAKAQVSTKAGKTEDDITDAGIDDDPDGEAIDPDAAVGDDPDAGNDGSGGNTGDEVPEGGGTADGSPLGTETDPLKARAASQYHGRILGFLYQGWSCTPNSKRECRASVSVSLSGTTITGVSFKGCGDPSIDGPAQALANSKVGQSIPPPPENYPELVPPSFNVSYGCNK